MHPGQPTSTPPTLTTILIGNGEMLCASVMRGTAILPRSEELYVSIALSEFARAEARLESKVCRSGSSSFITKRP